MEISKLYEQNKRLTATLKENRTILQEAIEALDKGEKVNGLEWGLEQINNVLEGEHGS